MEIVEGRGDCTGADAPEWGGPTGEIARPESAEPGLTQRGAAAGIEVGDGVDGFESDPEVTGAGPVGRRGQRVT
jgi:hypothetical protein